MNNKVVEKYYSPLELSLQVGFGKQFWRERCQSGDLTLTVDDVVIAEPLEISGELLIPASAVNAFLARHKYQYDAGIKARNKGELMRKLASREVVA